MGFEDAFVQEMYNQLAKIGVKLATLEERSVQHEKHNAERHNNLEKAIQTISTKLDENTKTTKTVAASMGCTTGAPWYMDSVKLKEIGMAIGLIITVAMGAVNASKLDALPKDMGSPIPPIKADINTGSTGK